VGEAAASFSQLKRPFSMQLFPQLDLSLHIQNCPNLKAKKFSHVCWEQKPLRDQVALCCGETWPRRLIPRQGGQESLERRGEKIWFCFSGSRLGLPVLERWKLT